MTTTYEQALALYYSLRPEAIAAYDRFILSRTPPALQPDMFAVLAPNLPKLMLSDTQIVPLKDEAGVDLPGWKGTCRATSQYSGYIEVAPETT
jgi:hypothetical protein